MCLESYRRVSFQLILIIVFIADVSYASAADKKGPLPGSMFDVRLYGAVGNGNTINTAAIQKAIDAASAAGGGTVYMAGGTFLSGTLYLKSHVTLYIESGATLRGSTRLEDFPVNIPEYRSYTDYYVTRSLIHAEKQSNITITGRGVIDGQGRTFHEKPIKERPFLMRIIECNDVKVEGITLRNSPCWVQHYLACNNVVIENITVDSMATYNNDGIDIDSCDKVRIANCNISCYDDAIVLKSTSDRACRNIVITNCVLKTNCHAFKLGTESNGGFQNIAFSNSTIYDSTAGVALELVDGGEFDGVSVSDIMMSNVGNALFVRLGNRARPYKGTVAGKGGVTGSDFEITDKAARPGMGTMQNIIISNIQARGIHGVGCAVAGIPGHEIKNITFDNIRMRFRGGGLPEAVERDIPEVEREYPDPNMFGKLPAYGFYFRHVRNLRFSDAELSFEGDDHRPAVVCDDVKDAVITGFDAQSASLCKGLLYFRNVDGVYVHSSRPRAAAAPFVYVADSNSKNVCISNNDFGRVEQVLKCGQGVDSNAVYVADNHTYDPCTIKKTIRFGTE